MSQKMPCWQKEDEAQLSFGNEERSQRIVRLFEVVEPAKIRPMALVRYTPIADWSYNFLDDRSCGLTDEHCSR